MKKLSILIMILIAGCGGSTQETRSEHSTLPRETGHPGQTASREAPPAPGNPREIAFPPITRTTTRSGLEVNVVEWNELPVMYVRLVIKSGSASDPKDMPGLAQLVSSMLKEGTKRRTSAQLAEEIEFLGADLDTDSSEEGVTIAVRALSEHLDKVLEIISDVVLHPGFRADELRKLKKRELDRLDLQENDPDFLANREFYRTLYGEHPYAHIDTTKEVVQKVKQENLAQWHKTYFVPSNAFLVVVGNTTSARVEEAANRAFGAWRNRAVTRPAFPAPPTRQTRSVIIVDRPDSVQSVIAIGNLALERKNPDYIPLLVANQVLGGSAASRLFMDLRERRSLTYGAYSGVDEAVEVGLFRAEAAVRSEVTAEAMNAFFEHLNRIIKEAPPQNEIQDAERFLSDSFPLRIETPAKIAKMIANLRIFGLPDDYWDTFREQIRSVTQVQSLEAARKYIKPDHSLVVVVGRAADIAGPLREYGPITVVDTSGKVLQEVGAKEPGAQ